MIQTVLTFVLQRFIDWLGGVSCDVSYSNAIRGLWR